MEIQIQGVANLLESQLVMTQTSASLPSWQYKNKYTNKYKYKYKTQETCSLTLTSGKVLFQFSAFILHTLSFTFIPIFRGGLLQGVKKRARLKVNRLVLTGHGQVQFHHSLILLWWENDKSKFIHKFSTWFESPGSKYLAIGARAPPTIPGRRRLVHRKPRWQRGLA